MHDASTIIYPILFECYDCYECYHHIITCYHIFNIYHGLRYTGYTTRILNCL